MTRRFLCAAALAFALGCLVALFTRVPLGHADPNGMIYSERTGNRPHGQHLTAWNTTTAQIADGTVVQVDSTASFPYTGFKGFKTWTGNVGDVRKIIGLLIGDTPGYAQGRILVRGYFNNATVDSTGLAGFRYLRPSLTTAGALTPWVLADSSNQYKPIVGTFQRYNSTSALVARVWVDFGGTR